VFEKFKGICAECGGKIAEKRWVCDHRLAIINGGENREDNLGPIHSTCDKTKTAADVAIKAKTARVKLKHLGIKKRKGRPMPGSRDSGFKRKIGGGWEPR
jgi:5-methylcytosine-specific restriction endonuclease McrA